MSIVQAMSELRAEVEREFDVESIRCKVMESFKQTELEINEQVSMTHTTHNIHVTAVLCSSVQSWRGTEQR